MAFTQKDLDALLSMPVNTYLNKLAKDKYDDFYKTDPFPDIPNALLNSADIVKYILTTGIVDPFTPEKLSGATYTCEFSGEYIYWDENRIKRKKKLSEDGEFPIKPNSIVFLGIEPIFYIPQYIALRFNLRVKNAYKGLLLGTGPIVDPGYVGKLFIPLHNLTSNEYRIKCKADLIDIEFTKISKNVNWDIKSDKTLMNIVGSFDFTSVPYIPKTFEQPRLNMESYESYIDKSLTADTSFAKEGTETPFVNSSMQEKIQDFNSMQINMEKKMEERIQEFNSIQKNIEKKIKELDYLKTFFTFTIAAVLIAALSLFVSSGWYFSKATELSEATQSISKQQEEYDRNKADFDELITKLQNRIDDLENVNDSSGDTP
jgi:deoxycytidine triphosphate deaminase/prefoldin subunit 5